MRGYTWTLYFCVRGRRRPSEWNVGATGSRNESNSDAGPGRSGQDWGDLHINDLHRMQVYGVEGPKRNSWVTLRWRRGHIDAKVSPRPSGSNGEVSLVNGLYVGILSLPVQLMSTRGTIDWRQWTVYSINSSSSPRKNTPNCSIINYGVLHRTSYRMRLRMFRLGQPLFNRLTSPLAVLLIIAWALVVRCA